MARPQKKGAKYFPLDVDFFGNDRRIKELKGKYGSDGIVVYIYLLCEIFKEGYFIKLDDGYEYVLSDDLNMSSRKIGQILNFLCRRSLFDNKLFTSDKVLTSHGIQLRFQKIFESLGQKRPIEVDERFWVLKKEETKGFIKFAHFESEAEKDKKNELFSEKNSDKSEKNTSKEKKEKEIENIHTCTVPTFDEVKRFCIERNSRVDPKKFFNYYSDKNWKHVTNWKDTFIHWENTQYPSKTPKSNYGIDYQQREYTEAELNEIFERKQN